MQAKQTAQYPKLRPGCHVALCVTVICLATLALNAQTLTTLYTLNGTDGAFPESALVQGFDGNFYGATTHGGPTDNGTFFRVTPTGTYTVLHYFQGPDGSGPLAPLAVGTDGALYGTTVQGGATNNGTVFKYQNGIFTLLHHFTGHDGSYAYGGVTQGADGAFYGVTVFGGNRGIGTAYKITSAGTFTKLGDLGTGNSVSGPYSQLLLASDGNFYGTSFDGGLVGEGTLFKLSTSGTVTVLYSFCPGGVPCADGGNVQSGVVQGADGSFYGSVVRGGDFTCTQLGFQGCGTIYRFNSSGLTTLHTFSFSDGANPVNRMVVANDGNLYGTLPYGAALNCTDGCGNIFSITPSGTFTALYNFCSAGDSCLDGANPIGALTQGTDGNFYGVTAFGGNGNGTVFALSTGLSPFVEALPGFGRVGANVRILGNNLTGTSSVIFNGVAATFTVVSNTYITATVPAGATTGSVQVVTPGGTLTSNMAFRVRP